MREKLFITLSLVLTIAALIGLNALSYSRVETEPDTEQKANRTTFNGGATGTRAFFDFLRETGRPVMRWQEKPAVLRYKSRANLPKTFVIVMDGLPRPFEEVEISDLLDWTAEGNRLVIVSRSPLKKLLPRSGNWQIRVVEGAYPVGDSTNSAEMTKGVTAAMPVQPSIFTVGVNSVMPSRFASSVTLDFFAPNGSEKGVGTGSGSGSGDGTATAKPTPKSVYESAPPKPTPTKPTISSSNALESSPTLTPAVYLTSKGKNILADYGYGAGRIVVLTDPYIISNGGLESNDNLRLATNIVGDDGGLIAFDEYHQGFGASGNALVNYFEGTPLLALVGQFAFFVVMLVWTRGRRFARPLPLPNPDRRSKLEYVGAMAELQRRTRAYDLAIENIYARVRRELARFAGVDNLTTPAPLLAQRVAERSRVNRQELEKLLLDCEDAIHGEPVRDKRALALVGGLREIERELGFKTLSRQAKIK